MAKYFFRLDDVAPNMNWKNFNLTIEIFKRHNIKPLIAVIPDVQDPKLLGWPIKTNFWLIINEMRNFGWIIAQHGYQHLSRGNGGILKIHENGELGGLSFEDQEVMINSGRKIIESQMICLDVFVAPRHSFDRETLRVLEKNNFHYISDGISLYPFKKWGLVWLPQILWRPRKWLWGMITVALHPNTMTQDDFNNLEKFIEKNRGKIGNFSEIMEWRGKSSLIKRFILFFINQFFKIFWYSIFYLKFKIKNPKP